MAARVMFQRRLSLRFDQLDFECDNSTFLKRLNFLVQGLRIKTRSVHRLGIPPILQIEPSNVCNLRCLTCPTGAGLINRPAAMMPFPMFRSVIDQVKDYVSLLVFWSWGEPFLNRDAFNMIRYAKDNGLLVHTSSNGHFLDSREQARKVVESGLDSLIIAADGLDQKTYEKYRKGGSLEKVIRSIRNIVSERASLGVDHPRITFRFIAMKHNEHQLEGVRTFAEGLGADAVSFRSPVLRRPDLDFEDRLAPLQPEYQRFSCHDSPSGSGRLKLDKNYCHRPYANLTIFSNGDVVACENDFNSTAPFGNVAHDSVRRILSSETPKAFLKIFRRDLDNFSFCRECENRYIRGHSANVRTIALKDGDARAKTD